ncbi:MAG: hypothetical protein ABSF65_09860 [Candidatus Bathyarchaeia archaeon]|jgi:hypothetical protein
MADRATSESQLKTIEYVKELFRVQFTAFVAAIKLALTNQPFFIHSPSPI